MKVISKANETVLAVLKRFLKADFRGRLLKYCVTEPTEDGVLLFNLLTREMVLLTQEEYGHVTELEYLRNRWFVVPEEINEKELLEFVRLVLKSQEKKSDAITGYTIFPTTDCNARCFYCYELGRSRIPMSVETAEKVAAYIKDHCGGNKIRITWFGGEPLMNQKAIDIICDSLRRDQVAFESKIVTNAYLFDADAVKKAVTKWNLKAMQVSLDGTQEVYNRVKAYVCADGNPYQIVLGNIERLLDNGIEVFVRMNMDLHNAEDLLALADELAARFKEKTGLKVYAHHLFKEGMTNDQIHTEEEWQKRSEAMRRLNEKFSVAGLTKIGKISNKLKINRCMADSGKSVTILPDGNIGLCEHFSESEFVGHIDREGFDMQVVESWKQPIPEQPECQDCFYAPECIKLKKCMSESCCYPTFREEKLFWTRCKMTDTYQNWLGEDGSYEA